MGIKNLFYWFTLLCSVRFFDLKIFGEFLNTNFEVLGGFSLILFIIGDFLRNPYGNSVDVPKTQSLKYLYLAIISSVIGSYYFNDQPFLNSIISSRVLFYFLFYIVLHIIRPSLDLIRKSLIAISVLYILIFIFQFLIYPNEIVFSDMNPDRAKVRIRLPGRSYVAFLSLWMFYLITTESKFKKVKAWILWVFSIISILLAVTRSVIFASFVSHILMLVKYQRKNLLKIIIPGIAAIVVFYFAVGLLDPQLLPNIISSSEEDKSLGEDYIRLQAFDYYLNEATKAPLSIVFGNGNPTGGANFTSAYSLKNLNNIQKGFYLDDLGVFGTIYRYGVSYFLFLVSLIVTTFKLFRKTEIYSKISYVVYFMIFLILLLPIIDLFGTNTDSIILICISLYLVDIYKFQKIQLAKEKKVNELLI